MFAQQDARFHYDRVIGEINLADRQGQSVYLILEDPSVLIPGVDSSDGCCRIQSIFSIPVIIQNSDITSASIPNYHLFEPDEAVIFDNIDWKIGINGGLYDVQGYFVTSSDYPSRIVRQPQI